jgi:hypothetical protein
MPPFDLTYPGTDAWQSNSAYIKQYQSALTYLAWKTNNPTWDPGGIDSTYGPDTAAAVSAYEGANGLTVDGEAGQAVATSLQAAIATAQASGLIQAGSRNFPGRDDDHMGSRNFPGRDDDHMGHAISIVGTRNFHGRDDDHVGALELVGRTISGTIGGVVHAGTRLFPGRDDDHVGAVAGGKWRSAAKAPAGLKASLHAATQAMAQDHEVPLGVSTHTVNGVLVRVLKQPGRVLPVSYHHASR